MSAGSGDAPAGAGRPAGPDLAALTGSRICHDLNNPLGAIGNGLELLALVGRADGPEMALIAESVARAQARVRFLHVAFGAAAPGAAMPAGEAGTILSERARDGRVRIDWAVAGAPERAAVKLAFLVVMCLESAMPFGGSLRVEQQAGGWRATGTAKRVRPLPAEWALAQGRADAGAEITAPLIQFALAAEAARATGRRIALHEGEGALTVTF